MCVSKAWFALTPLCFVETSEVIRILEYKKFLIIVFFFGFKKLML